MNFFLRIILVLADLIGLNALFRRINVERTPILMYHGVADRSLLGSIWTVIPKSEFEWQMRYLKKRFTVQPASSLLESAPNKTNRAIVTFDDGLANTHKVAAPILRELDLPAICFVLPGLSERGQMIWADELMSRLLDTELSHIDLNEFDIGTISLSADKQARIPVIGKLLSRLKRMPHRQRTKVTKRITDITGDHGGQSAQSLFQLMTIDEIRRLHSEYDMEIGLHTNTHPILSRMSPEEQAEEIEGCIHALRENDIPFVWIFAYPNGNPEDFDAETQAILRRSGITRALTTIDGLHDENDDPLTMKRVAIGSTCGRYEFKARLSGLFYALQRLRRR